MNINIRPHVTVPGPSWGLSEERPEKGKSMPHDEMKPKLSPPVPTHVSQGWGKLFPYSHLKTCFSFSKHLLQQLQKASNMYF